MGETNGGVGWFGRIMQLDDCSPEYYFGVIPFCLDARFFTTARIAAPNREKHKEGESHVHIVAFSRSQSAFSGKR